MLRTLTLSVLLTALVGAVSAQSFRNYGVYYDQATATQYLAAIDNDSGTVTTLYNVPGVSGWVLGSSVFDYLRGHYLFRTNLGLTVINAADGAVIDTLAFSENLSNMVYDEVADRIVGTYWQNGTEYFGYVDFQTDAVVPVAALPGVLWKVVGAYLFDWRLNQYVCVTNLGVTVIDAATGLIVNTFPTVGNLSGFAYDDATGARYGTYWNGTAQKLVQINLATAQIEEVGTILGVESYAVGSATFDAFKNQYLFVTNLGVTAVNAADAAVVNVYPSVGNLSGTVGNKIRQALVVPDGSTLRANVHQGVQWYRDGEALAGATGATLTPDAPGEYFVRVTNQQGTTGESAPVVFAPTSLAAAAAAVSVYPNPAVGTLTLEAPAPIRSVRWANALGQVVGRQDFADGQSRQTLRVGQWTRGTYFVEVTAGAAVTRHRVALR